MENRKATVLRLNKEFRTLYYHGRSQVSPVLVTYVKKNRLGVCRVGITTGKKIGKAVTRNRCRRLIREAYRLISPQIKGTWDIVFVARTRTATASMPQVKKAMTAHFQALTLLPSIRKGSTDENDLH